MHLPRALVTDVLELGAVLLAATAAGLGAATVAPALGAAAAGVALAAGSVLLTAGGRKTDDAGGIE